MIHDPLKGVEVLTCNYIDTLTVCCIVREVEEYDLGKWLFEKIIVNNNVGYLKLSQTHANLFFLNERGLDELQVTLLYHILLLTNDSVHECEQLILNFINPNIFMNNAHICIGGGGEFMIVKY